MESNIPDQQGSIQVKSYVLCIIQFTGNILIDNEQYIPRALIQRSIGRLLGWLCNICQDQKIIRRKNYTILKDGRET